MVLPVVNAAKNRFPGGSLVFKRAMSLDNGVNISWLEHTWDNDVLDKNVIKASDFQLLKQFGFKSIRLPVAFEHFQTGNRSIQKVYARIDKTLKWCKLYGFKLTICYHSGNLNDNNYLTEAQNVIAVWKILTKRYINQSAGNLFFDIYNEPPHMNPDAWKDAAGKIVTAIRQLDNRRTLIVGASLGIARRVLFGA